MGEFCENCGKLMKRWDATHCSEECLLESVRNSKSLHDGDGIEKMLRDMRNKKYYDINLLEQLK